MTTRSKKKMSDPDLLFDVRDHVAWLVLNRPSRGNAISLAMLDLFDGCLDRAQADPEVRALCITGAGDRAFCSGADLGTAHEGGGLLAAARKYASLIERLQGFPKPIVARLNGHCLAGGMGLMLSCDIVYAHAGIRIGTPEVKVGLFPMMIGALIFRNATRKKALEMIYTAEPISAADAEQMGLVTRVLDQEDLDRAVEKTLSRICANAPLAVQRGRKALAAATEMGLSEALAYLCEELGELAKTEDAAEGVAAFRERRAPRWKGR